MLRNSVQSALCSLVVLSVTACTDTKPLISGDLNESSVYNIRIKADPFIQYRFSEVMNRVLACYVKNLRDYIITVSITENSSSALYTSDKVAKEQIRLAANIEVYDKDYNHIGSKSLDSYTTYEVGDDLPHTINSSINQARISAVTNLAHASALAIRVILIR